MTLTDYTFQEKEVGRGLTNIDDCVDASIRRLEDYKEKRREGLITATRNNINNTRKNRTIIPRKQKWEEKQLYRRFNGLINNNSHEKNWTWLKKRNLKRETGFLLIATQTKAIWTNYIKVIINKTQQNSICRLYSDRDEIINHIREYSKLAQKEYRH